MQVETTCTHDKFESMHATVSRGGHLRGVARQAWCGTAAENFHPCMYRTSATGIPIHACISGSSVPIHACIRPRFASCIFFFREVDAHKHARRLIPMNTRTQPYPYEHRKLRCRREHRLPLKAQTPLNPRKFAPTGSRTQDLSCYRETLVTTRLQSLSLVFLKHPEALGSHVKDWVSTLTGLNVD